LEYNQILEDSLHGQTLSSSKQEFATSGPSSWGPPEDCMYLNFLLLRSVIGNPSSCPLMNPVDRWRQEIAFEKLIQRAHKLQF
jgi:hypothetical protein